MDIKNNLFNFELNTRPNTQNLPLESLHTMKSMESPNPFQLLRVLKDNADLANKEIEITKLNEGIKKKEEKIKKADLKIENIQKDYLEVKLRSCKKGQMKEKI